MNEEKLKEFNEKLGALLKEYNVSLDIQQKIVVKSIPEKTEEATPEKPQKDKKAKA